MTNELIEKVYFFKDPYYGILYKNVGDHTESDPSRTYILTKKRFTHSSITIKESQVENDVVYIKIFIIRNMRSLLGVTILLIL
ncbi:uncharacterized protein OCT59_017342 [Rhizophagus irregularis]|uniref:Uncharacterized protein n=1 Tax=Rhizophagus irregularis TaxID=588596 RepID=A0A915ZH01_9GLOM|nr:hypothetical protein OCT59_017342 [Rhizophagus irregularis]CAB4374591.1 unnamed protein product [Rhizophagus irregularis]CAB4491399.1 unnamed protein product [Rhizophagus irregularis]CAB5139813.1 unnamed protein product [Rhizophagus irregularis]CAB5358933.1 unnamed protein product [Rhizophagus irregularis]